MKGEKWKDLQKGKGGKEGEEEEWEGKKIEKKLINRNMKKGGGRKITKQARGE